MALTWFSMLHKELYISEKRAGDWNERGRINNIKFINLVWAYKFRQYYAEDGKKRNFQWTLAFVGTSDEENHLDWKFHI